MQSWSYLHGGKGFVSNETISPSDAITRSKTALLGWDLRTACSFGNNMVISSQQAIENHNFGEFSHQELMEKQLPDCSVRDDLSREVDGGKIINPLMVNTHDFSLKDEPISMLSGSVLDSNSKDSSLIDLKLGRFADPTDAPNSRISKGASILSSSESSTPPKRVKVGASSRRAICQVYGCNKDLSSSKEYHKRHKVCEIHSKTAKVIVNGIEQRFCQQCSRFHLLAEFDDGKRSCRKRLAGHNERRRRPQVSLHHGRSGRLLQSYNVPAGFAAGRFCGTASFVCQDILGGSLNPEKYGTNNYGRQIKVEDGSDFNPLSSIPVTRNIFGASVNRYPHDLRGSNSDSRSLIQDASAGNEDFPVFDALSTIQGLSGITNSGSALSLLSSQSQNCSSHSSEISIACPLVVPGSNTRSSVCQLSEKLVGVNSQASTSGVRNKFSSSGASSAKVSHLGSILISDGSDAVNFDVTNSIYQESNFMNAKDRLSCEDDITIDILQLSSQLQRVEHQKQSIQVKLENDAFCWPHIS